MVGGLDGDPGSSHLVAETLKKYEATPQSKRRFRLIAIPQANPENARVTFPPVGVAYKENPESHYLWRWIGIHAPDLVLVVGEDRDLVAALPNNAVAGVGGVPARRFAATDTLLGVTREVRPSAARTEIDRRLKRTPIALARELEAHYGHEWRDPVYVPGMSLIGRMRLGHVEDVQRIVAPYLEGRDPLEKATASHLSGHLVFAELAERTRDRRYVDLVRKAADLGFSGGQMKESMPFHNEMSDAVFMSCPILVKAGKLTGDRKYFDMASRHFKFMEKLCLRPDGLYRHSPLDEAAWSRGNAFPLLGLALSLGDMPADYPGRKEMLVAFRKLAAALHKVQDEDGMWRQVIDKPGAYPEFSATAMIGTALLRGVRRGWLEAAAYQPAIDAAWEAILARVKDGAVVDVCESTGKQKSLEDYLNRVAILGQDTRGGGMAFLFATEMAGLR
jgi:rhamnogalacturonyl hydrolase YesR